MDGIHTTTLYPKVFRHILDALEEEELAYSAKITCIKEDYIRKSELPVIIYAPSAIAVKYVTNAAKVMKKVLKEFHVDKKIFFKPDVFTIKGIYSGKASHKSYIYIF